MADDAIFVRRARSRAGMRAISLWRRVSKSLSHRTSQAAISATAIALVLLGWEVLAWVFQSNLIPSFSQVMSKGYELLATGELIEHTRASLIRIMAGFLIGSLVGAPLGLLMGVSTTARAALDPFVQFFRFIPAIAWLTPVVIWFGIGDTSKIIIIFYATVFTVAINAAVGVANIPENKIWAGLTLGANRGQIFRFIVLPAALPYVLTGMRLAMGYAFTGVVSAEMIASDEGLGFLIFNSRLWMATDAIFVAILVLGLLGWGCDYLFRYLMRRLTHIA